MAPSNRRGPHEHRGRMRDPQRGIHDSRRHGHHERESAYLHRTDRRERGAPFDRHAPSTREEYGLGGHGYRGGRRRVWRHPDRGITKKRRRGHRAREYDDRQHVVRSVRDDGVRDPEQWNEERGAPVGTRAPSARHVYGLGAREHYDEHHSDIKITNSERRGHEVRAIDGRYHRERRFGPGTHENVERGTPVDDHGPFVRDQYGPDKRRRTGRTYVSCRRSASHPSPPRPRKTSTRGPNLDRNDDSYPQHEVKVALASPPPHCHSKATGPASVTHPESRSVPSDQKEGTGKDITPTSLPIVDDRLPHDSLPLNSLSWHVHNDIGSAGIDIYEKWHSRCINGVDAASIQPRLSRKCLKLLGLMFKEYRTLTSKMSMVVYARNPVVSIILSELLGMLPMFQNLRVDVLIGKPYEAPALEGSRRSFPVSGDREGDIRILDNFRCGALNVLIVVSSNLTYIRNNYQMPHASCVADFVDGKHSKEMLNCDVSTRFFVFKASRKRRVKVVDNALKRIKREKHSKRFAAGNYLPMRYQKAALALLGPKVDDDGYLYALSLPCEEDPLDIFRTQKESRTGTTFGVILSGKLLAEDMELHLRALGCETKGDEKPLVLKFVGQLKLEQERMDAIRRYHAKLFRTVLRNVKERDFEWEQAPRDYGDYSAKHEGRGLEYLKNYVVVPLIMAKLEGNLPLSNALHAIDFRSIDKTKGNLEVKKPSLSGKESLFNHIKDLKGSLACSSVEQKRKKVPLLLVGFPRYDLSPLSSFVKSNSFKLNKDGSFVPDPFIRRLTRAHQVEDQVEDVKNRVPLYSEFPECHPTLGKPELFDPKRNRAKNREYWSGQIRLNFVEDLSRNWRTEVNIMEQPLMTAVELSVLDLNIDVFTNILRGLPLRHLLCLMVQNKADEQRKESAEKPCLEVPEVTVRHPYFTIDSLLLPCLLSNFENHVSLCQLRNELQEFFGIRLPLDLLFAAITPRNVNEKFNFERLELLGDRILGLHITLRNFVRKPRDREKFLHDEKRRFASNAALSKNMEEKNEWIIDRINFSGLDLSQWKPPGSHKIGCCLSTLNHKSFSDVTEALSAAFFISEYNKALSGNAQVATENETLSNNCVWKGMEASGQFLEKFGLFQGADMWGAQPSHDSLLKSVIATLHNSVTSSSDQFPVDARVSNLWEEIGRPFENLFGYKFQHRNLLFVACTLNSYKLDELNHNIEPIRFKELVKGYRKAFQRLEFLGDELVGLYVVAKLYMRYPNASPGEITSLKSKCVSNEIFGRIVLRNGMERFLFFMDRQNEHGLESIGKKINTMTSSQLDIDREVPPKFLGDFFEACLGAIFVDATDYEAGFQAVFGVLDRLMSDTFREYGRPEFLRARPEEQLLDFIRSELGLAYAVPMFDVFKKGKWFEVVLTLLGEVIGRGDGLTKVRAKQIADLNAFTTLKNSSEDNRVLRKIHRIKEKYAAAIRGSELK